MPFRTVVIDSHCKLEYSLNYLVVRTSETTKRIVMDEVRVLVLNSTMISITTALLAECTKRKISVVCCDDKHNPCSLLLPLCGNSITSKRIRQQVDWKKETADACWQKIIANKIRNQATLLKLSGRWGEASLLEQYVQEVEPGDPTNREGHAAKVYFNSVFYPGFTREEDCLTNAALNYGYSLILSEISRAIAAGGYLTQLGIHHKSEFNEFALSCDLMEPVRFLVDRKVKRMGPNEEWKKIIMEITGEDVCIRGQTQSFGNAISIYTNSFFSAMEEDNPEKIVFIEFNG